jgi:hypothetical protein
MSEAVDAVVEKKFGSNGCFDPQCSELVPFKEWNEIYPGFVIPTKKNIQIVKDYCNYIYDHYGRFPATTDTIMLTIWMQVHHLDIEFYKKYYGAEILTENHYCHNERWHKSDIRNI